MKKGIISLFAIIAYYCGLDAIFYRLNRKAKRILTFHNVLPDALFRDGIANGVSNRLSDFEIIVDECARKFRFSTDLFDPNTLTITFDDGYQNQYSTAFKSLRKRGIRAYLFVAGDCLDGETLVVDRLLNWVAEAPIELIPGGDRLRYWCEDIWPKFVKDSNAKGLNVLKELDKIYSEELILEKLPSDYKHERLDCISTDELDEMRGAGWKIGWHTKSHYPLARLSNDALNEELDSSDEFRQVCLSYPYGNPVEVGEAAVKLAKALGFPCAVSNTNSVVPSLHFLPRMSLLPNKYRLHFQLSGLDHFVRHGSLLPKMGKSTKI